MLNDAAVSHFKKVYLAPGYTDLRRGIDGFASIVRFQFELDPFPWIIIVGFCNVILFTPGRYIHTFRTVLTFSDLFCPVHKADLLCNQTGLFCHSEYLHK